MKIFLGILALIVCLAIVFFIFNVANLEVVKLDNGIGSYSIVNVDLYDKTNTGNVNTNPIAVAPNYIGDFDYTFFINEASLNINSSSSRYPNLTELYENIRDNVGTFMVLNNKFDLIIKCDIFNFSLPKEVPSNIPMTPQRFHELYPTGLDMNISNVRTSKIILGALPEEDNFNTIDNLKVRVYSAPNPNGNGQYLINIVPYGFSYEYNFLHTLSNLDSDLQTIKNAKPNLSDFSIDSNISEQKWYEYALGLMVHPIKLFNYYSISAEIIISDLSGMVLVNELEAYSPF